MRALQLKSQWTRTSAAANVDAAVAASARATRSYDARGIGAVDRLHRRRAPVFMSATPSAAGAEGTATSRFVQRVRLILPHAILVSATVLYAVLGALCFTYTEQASETGHLSRYAKNAIAAQASRQSQNSPDNRATCRRRLECALLAQRSRFRDAQRRAAQRYRG